MSEFPPILPDVAPDLAMAVIESSNTPLLLLGGDLSIIAASTSFCRAFEIDPESPAGHQLADLGAGEWGCRKLLSLLKATAAGRAEIDAYEIDLRREGRGTRRLILNAQKLSYSDKSNVRLLLSVIDITEARAADRLRDDMLREKAVLLQELQHRVANSLQIIASVLLQSARRVQSNETREHLQAAHQRVMSVAAVQRQLSITELDRVELRSYFSQLCLSLGASMISDPGQLSIELSSDASTTNADVSVSLGLIVTELVVNALKHAFPGDRRGKIAVDYQAHGNGWTLSVSDDGIGIHKQATGVTARLGTNIVLALARHLHSEVRVRNIGPGTCVSIIHSQIAIRSEKIGSNFK